MTDSYFRGYHAIGEVAAKAKRLAEHAGRFTRDLKVLRLYRRDYDLVARWPNAAKLHGFEFTGAVISYGGFRIDCDRTPERYPVNRPKTGGETVDLCPAEGSPCGDRHPPLSEVAAPPAREPPLDCRALGDNELWRR